jgi:FKBP-type peptidyl-prolyl cis-trans isomerase
MKQTILTFLFLSVFGFISCRKDKLQQTIQQLDQQQILNYIASHNLTGFVKDTVGGDTSGIYYKILTPGTGPALKYSDEIPMVYSLQTFDGTYTSGDTINNHYYDYVGHIYSNKLPLGLQTAIISDLKYRGGRMRVLIPSHLAYGVDGTGSGSSQVANNRIKGNECLDYYVNIVNNFPVYDDLVIRNYMRDSSLVGYTKTADGLYYKVLTQATTNDPITINSTITCTYTGQLLNASIFDGSSNGTNTATLAIADFATPGNVEGLENYASVGTKISLLIPSSLGYGLLSQTGIPPFSCLRFTWLIDTVTP